MINIIMSGCGGRMGRAVIETVRDGDSFRIIAGVDINCAQIGATCSFPVYQSISEFPGKADVIIDFSNHASLSALAHYAENTKTPLVIATTGHTEEEKLIMKKTAEKTAVFFSRNMSLGINLLIEICKKASSALGTSFDIEIIEKHHNKKLDAPSGTALMIAESLTKERAQTEFVYDRHAVRKARESKEIGIHAVRGGSIVGEHEVIFAGKDETLTISHSAMSREIFAEGALRAATFIADKKTGLYDMSDLISSTLKI